MIKRLEDIQSLILDNLPAIIASYVVIMDGVIAVIVECNSSLLQEFENFRNNLLGVCQSCD